MSTSTVAWSQPVQWFLTQMMIATAVITICHHQSQEVLDPQLGLIEVKIWEPERCKAAALTAWDWQIDFAD